MTEWVFFFHGTGQDIPDHTFSRSHIHGMMHRVIIDPACVGTHHACLSRSRRGRGRGGGRGRRGNGQRTKCKNDKKKRGVWPGSNAETTQEVQQRRNREQQKVCGLATTISVVCQGRWVIIIHNRCCFGEERWKVYYFSGSESLFYIFSSPVLSVGCGHCFLFFSCGG